jgi:hypothetical protein
LNTTRHEIEKAANEGDEFFTVLSSMYSSADKPTSLKIRFVRDLKDSNDAAARSDDERNKKRRYKKRYEQPGEPRAIDWLFSNVPLTDVVLAKFTYSVSDHTPIAVEISIRKTTSTLRLPDRGKYEELMSRLLKDFRRTPTIMGLNRMVQ